MGLLNRIKRTNVTRNVWTQMAQITIICGLIVATGTAITCNQGDHCGLAFVSVAAIAAVAIVFIAWLVWFIYVIWAKRYLTPMALHGNKILDSIDFLSFHILDNRFDFQGCDWRMGSPNSCINLDSIHRNSNKIS